MARDPKPTKLLEFEKGKLYSDQRDRQAYEPKASREVTPRCPQRFTAEERKVWRGLAAVLKNYGLFTAANAIQLELLATAWTQYVEAGYLLATKTKGMMFIADASKPGGFMENPIIRTQQRLRAEVSTYSQNLGLGSVAMAKIGSMMLRKKKEKDEFFED